MSSPNPGQGNPAPPIQQQGPPVAYPPPQGGQYAMMQPYYNPPLPYPAQQPYPPQNTQQQGQNQEREAAAVARPQKPSIVVLLEMNFDGKSSTSPQYCSVSEGDKSGDIVDQTLMHQGPDVMKGLLPSGEAAILVWTGTGTCVLVCKDDALNVQKVAFEAPEIKIVAKDSETAVSYPHHMSMYDVLDRTAKKSGETPTLKLVVEPGRFGQCDFNMDLLGEGKGDSGPDRVIYIENVKGKKKRRKPSNAPQTTTAAAKNKGKDATPGPPSKKHKTSKATAAVASPKPATITAASSEKEATETAAKVNETAPAQKNPAANSNGDAGAGPKKKASPTKKKAKATKEPTLSGDDAESSGDKGSDGSKWSDHLVRKLRKLYKDGNPTDGDFWENIAKNFKSYTPDQCREKWDSLQQDASAKSARKAADKAAAAAKKAKEKNVNGKKDDSKTAATSVGKEKSKATSPHSQGENGSGEDEESASSAKKPAASPEKAKAAKKKSASKKDTDKSKKNQGQTSNDKESARKSASKKDTDKSKKNQGETSNDKESAKKSSSKKDTNKSKKNQEGTSNDKESAPETEKVVEGGRERSFVYLKAFDVLWNVLVDKCGWSVEEKQRADSKGSNRSYFPRGVTRESGKIRHDYFDSKRQVLDYIRTNDTWKNDATVKEALAEYDAKAIPAKEKADKRIRNRIKRKSAEVSVVATDHI